MAIGKVALNVELKVYNNVQNTREGISVINRLEADAGL